MNELEEKLIELCLESDSKDPLEIFRKLTALTVVSMNGPIHHTIVPMSLITATWHVKPDFDLRSYLTEAVARSLEVPGTICGYWGCCGSSIGAGMYFSIMTRTTPLTRGKRWSNGNLVTSRALEKVSGFVGPRCCKRNAVLSIMSACESAEELLGIRMEPSEYKCGRYDRNPECIGARCPFHIQKK